MVGLERANTSLVGTRVFHVSGYLAVFSFIIAFGVTKALANLVAGPLTARHTPKNLLVAGWAAGLPVPFVLAVGATARAPGTWPRPTGCARLGLAAIGLIKGLYPMLRGGGQLFTGRLADIIGRRPLIVSGMMIEAAAFPTVLLLLARPLMAGLASAILLGPGPRWPSPRSAPPSPITPTRPGGRRASGVYRFWRDLGYAIGAVIAGLLSHAFNLSAAVIAGGAITFASGLLAARWIMAGPSPSVPVLPAASGRPAIRPKGSGTGSCSDSRQPRLSALAALHTMDGFASPERPPGTPPPVAYTPPMPFLLTSKGRHPFIREHSGLRES